MLFLLPPCFSGSSEGKRGSGQPRLELHVKDFWRRQQLRGFLLVSYIRFLFPPCAIRESCSCSQSWGAGSSRSVTWELLKSTKRGDFESQSGNLAAHIHHRPMGKVVAGAMERCPPSWFATKSYLLKLQCLLLLGEARDVWSLEAV